MSNKEATEHLISYIEGLGFNTSYTKTREDNITFLSFSIPRGQGFNTGWAVGYIYRLDSSMGPTFHVYGRKYIESFNFEIELIKNEIKKHFCGVYFYREKPFINSLKWEGVGGY